jgi:hypothetical protein
VVEGYAQAQRIKTQCNPSGATIPPPPQQYYQPKPSNGMGVAGFVLGLVGAVLGLIPLLAFVALICGILGLVFGIVGATRKGIPGGWPSLASSSARSPWG